MLFPASFAYLIASDQLYDIGLVFRRFLFGCLLALVPASIVTGLFMAFFQETATNQMIVFVFFSCLLALALMLYSTEYLTTRLEPIFFPRKAMLNNSLKKISRNLSTVSTMREMKDIFLADIVQTLDVQGGSIVCQYPDSVETISAGEVNEEEIKAILAQKEWSESERYTCMEISRTEESTNYLVMTRKRTNVLLSREEQQWLGLITSYLEVSLENVHLIRTLTAKLQDLSSRFSDDTSAVEFQWFRKVMFELQEEERIRIASDLHDTTMQDLFFLKRRFSGLMDKYVMNREDKEHLDNILKFVDLINASLRQSCFELNPHLLREIGLIGTLRQYLEKEAYVAAFHIHFEPESGAGRVEQESLTTKRHLLRIVQELLNNAKKHSQASKVSFRLTSTSQHFQLIYEDDGIGIRPMEPGSREIGGSGIGMEQMKGRILLMQGSLKMVDLPRPGTQMVISIPLQEQEQEASRKSV
ncbi:sensor histidine kinase [Paenibacillus mesotrionivorans]|uniref:Sensor histidine kinase n=1 Tax=Paenibacillus mesotrionivorans TaxID=3160968 RepID=A0ACC7P2A8_9BACL